MVNRVRGKRGGHSRGLRKHREKTTVNSILREFKDGATVVITIDSAVQGGSPHPRYQGKVGKIVKKRGDCYEVKIKDGDKDKILVTAPVHLKIKKF